MEPPEGTLIPRAPARVFALGVWLLLFTFVGQLATDLLEAKAALPISVRLSGLASDRLRQASIFRVCPLGSVRELPSLFLPSGQREWQLQTGWARAFRIRLPEDSLAELTGMSVLVGEVMSRVDAQEIRSTWRRVAEPSATLLEGVSLCTIESPPRETSTFAPGRYALNWPDTRSKLEEINVLADSLIRPLAITALFLFLAWATGRLWSAPTARALLSTALDAHPGDPGLARRRPLRDDCLWLAMGALLLLAIFARLHAADRYWFTQDDNRVQFLPNVLRACRATANGEMPSFSPHEHLGCPTIEPGHYPLTYPPLYFCHAVARHLLGDEQMTLQLWSWLHLSLGLFTSYLFGRAAGLGPPLAMTAALSFTLSGFFLVLGRAWVGVSPIAFWFPLLMLPFARQPTAGSWKWVVALGTTLGFAYHSGNAQFWVYSAMFVVFAAAATACSGKAARSRTLLVVPAFLLGAAIALPLLLPQLAWAARLERIGGENWGILEMFPRMVLPGGLVELVHTDSWSSRPQAPVQIFYSGSLLLGFGLAALLLLAGTLGACRNGLELLGRNPWLVLGAIGLVLAAGQDGFLWSPLSNLPGFHMLNHPFKMLPYLTFALVMGGAIVCERSIAASRKRSWIEAGLFLAVALLLARHADPAQPCFTRWDIPLPYPSREEVLGDQWPADGSGRMMPLCQAWNGERGNLASLSFSLPAIYGLYSMDGYNPLVSASAENQRAATRMVLDPLGAARAYGVRRFLLRPGYRPPPFLLERAGAADMTTSKLDSPWLLERVRGAAKAAPPTPRTSVWELTDARPLAFEAHTGRELPIRFRGDGADIDTSGLGGASSVVVNLLARPAMHASCDGRFAAIAPDRWDRVTVQVDAGTRVLAIRYRPNFGLGILLGLALAVMALILTAILLKLGRKFTA